MLGMRRERIKVGMVSEPINTRFSPTALLRFNHLAAVASRVDSFWLPDHLNALLPRSLATPKYLGIARITPRIDAYLEPWTMLGHVAGWNRLGRLRLGIGVTDSSRRNPAVTAQAAATLHLVTRGRTMLGIGTGERVGNEPYGVDWRTPVGRFEEAVATIRALWDSGGQLVSRASPYFPLDNAVFDIPPYRGKWPEIWIAAHGPRMLSIAGRYADAWFPGLPQRPREYAERLDVVRSAASDAGRDPGTVIPAIWLFVSAANTRDDVAAALDSDIARFFALGLSGEQWHHHGVEHPISTTFTGFQDLVPQNMDACAALAYAAHAPASLLSETLMTGTVEDVIGQAAVWRDHGARYLVLCNIGFLQPSLRKGLAAARAFQSVVRRLRTL